MINRVVLVGRLTKDPELRYTPSGIASCRFTLAVNRPFQGQNGEKEADFIQCIAWRKQAENLANYQRKGNLIGVEGRIQTGSYEGQDGKRVYTTDVVSDAIQFLEPRSNDGQAPAPQSNGGGFQNPPQQNNGQGGYNNPPPQNNGHGGYNNPPQTQQRQQSDFSNPNGQNYTRIDEDPFARQNNKGPIEVTEDDLPFD